jgi:hypothetical protein
MDRTGRRSIPSGANRAQLAEERADNWIEVDPTVCGAIARSRYGSREQCWQTASFIGNDQFA